MIVGTADAPRDAGEAGVATVYLSNAGGLTQFGAYLATLPKGGTTGERHWHSAEDEFLYVLGGTATVIDDGGPHDLAPGDAAVWRAGVPNAHCVRNLTEAPCII